MKTIYSRVPLIAHVMLLIGLTGAAWTNASAQTIKTVAGNGTQGFSGNGGAPQAKPVGERAHTIENYGHLPMSFEVNRGQTDAQVKFLSRGSGYTLFLAPNEAVLAFHRSGGEHEFRESNPRTQRSSMVVRHPRSTSENGPQTTSAALKMKLVGANPTARVIGLEELPGKSNYFIGNDPKEWQTNVPTFAKVRYEGVYPGVDLVYYGNQSQLEFDFVVAPGADPTAITLDLSAGLPPHKSDGDVKPQLRITEDGGLVVQTDGGEVHFHKPTAYQVISKSGRRSLVDGHYVLRQTNPQSSIKDQKLEVSFELASYDRSKPLIIDPYVSYSTYLGSDNDQAFGIAVDATGNAYITGVTSNNVFVRKLNPSGTALIYSTSFGGKVGIPGSVSAYQAGFGIAADPAGNAYVTGWTSSSDFPTTSGAFQTQPPTVSTTGFVSKIDPSGSVLVYSTYLGGPQTAAFPGAITVDSSGRAYVTGSAGSDFPVTQGVVQPVYGGGDPFGVQNQDAFVTKLTADGSALSYSTFLGGSGTDKGRAIAVDASGNAYLTGSTTSSNFPTTPGAFISTCDIATLCNGGYSNTFVSKLNPTATSLVYSTYFGASFADDEGDGIAVDSAGNAYVAGTVGASGGSSLPATPGAYQTTCNVDNTGFCAPTPYVTKLNPTGSGLVFSTYAGTRGLGNETAVGMALDASGNTYILGDSFGIVFVRELNTDGSAQVFSMYLNSSGASNGAYGIAVDSAGSVYAAGTAASAEFPITPGSFSPTGPGWIEDCCLNGNQAGFAFKVSPADSPGVAFSHAGLTFANQQAVGSTSPSQDSLLLNLGTQPLAISSIATTGDFLQSNTCGNSLAPAGMCTITVSFAPSSTGTRTGTVTVVDNAPGSPHAMSLVGSGIAPVPTFVPPSLSFPSQAVGSTSQPQTITLTNTGIGALNVFNFLVFGTSEFPFTTDCGLVGQGMSCTFTFSFRPQTGGLRTGSLMVYDNALGSPQAVALSGTGIGPNSTLSTDSLTYTSQLINTTSGPQSVTLTNNGNAPLTISGLAVAGDFAQTNNCGSSVNAGASCSINVTFDPSVGGTRTGSITISDNAGNSPQTVALSGAGEDFTIGPASGSSTSQSVPAGQTATYMLAFSPAGGFAGTLTLTCTGAPAGATCTPSPASVSLSGTTAGTSTISVTTTAKTTIAPPSGLRILPPSARWRPVMPWLLVWLLALALWMGVPARQRRLAWATLGTTMLVVVAWAACGGGGATPPPPAPVAVISAGSLTFNSQNMGSPSAAKSVTLSNTGNAALTISAIALMGVNSGDFAQTNTCGLSLAVGANCALNVTFTPGATGARNASLSVTDNATGSPQMVSLVGTGVPPATPTGTYTLTLTAVSSNGVTHTIPLTLTVM